MKHSPTPWWVEVHDFYTSIESKYYTISDDVTNDDAERIVKCVNACEAIPDPDAFIQAAMRVCDAWTNQGNGSKELADACNALTLIRKGI